MQQNQSDNVQLNSISNPIPTSRPLPLPVPHHHSMNNLFRSIWNNAKGELGEFWSGMNEERVEKKRTRTGQEEGSGEKTDSTRSDDIDERTKRRKREVGQEVSNVEHRDNHDNNNNRELSFQTLLPSHR
jgi:hypothetical protein